MTRIAIIDITGTTDNEVGLDVNTYGEVETAIEITYSIAGDAYVAWVNKNELHCARRDGLDSIETVEV